MRRIMMPELSEPFDVNTIEEAGQPETHDSAGARISNRGTAGGINFVSDLKRLAQGRQDPAELVQETQHTSAPEVDYVNHPPHYTANPSGIECIVITEWMNFNVGNAVKYCWRASEKGFEIQDLKKARWYIDREISRLEKLRDGKEKVV